MDKDNKNIINVLKFCVPLKKSRNLILYSNSFICLEKNRGSSFCVMQVLVTEFHDSINYAAQFCQKRS